MSISAGPLQLSKTVAAPRSQAGAVRLSRNGEPERRRALQRPGRLVFGGLLVLLLFEYHGLARMVPLVAILRVPTLLAVTLFLTAVVKGDRSVLFGAIQHRLVMGLVGMTALSVTYAIVQLYALQSLTPILGYFGLGIVAAYAVDRADRAVNLATALSAIGAFLVLRDLANIGDESRMGLFGGGYFLGDGNDFAWGLNVLLPFALFLLSVRTTLLRRGLGAISAVLMIVGIIGTFSRGGSLALGACLVFHWLFISKRRLLGAIAVAVIAAGVLALAPPSYFSRMETISSYEEDSSAMGRVRAWRSAVEMAIDYPLGVGAGNFNSAYGRFYLPPDAPGGKWISAHSVYFKTLGEFGFPGLALLLALLFVNLRRAMVAVTTDLNGPTVFPVEWPKFLAMALVGYAFGGLFLGGVFYPHLYLITGLIVGCHHRLVVSVPGASASVKRLPMRVAFGAPSGGQDRPRLRPRPGRADRRPA